MIHGEETCVSGDACYTRVDKRAEHHDDLVDRCTAWREKSDYLIWRAPFEVQAERASKIDAYFRPSKGAQYNRMNYLT